MRCAACGTLPRGSHKDGRRSEAPADGMGFAHAHQGEGSA